LIDSRPRKALDFFLQPQREALRQFWSSKAMENCPETGAGYALFVVTPEPENFYHSFVFEHLVHNTMLNINAARAYSCKITNKLFERRRPPIRIFRNQRQQFLSVWFEAAGS
jgi:hypothetical protein